MGVIIYIQDNNNLYSTNCFSIPSLLKFKAINGAHKESRPSVCNYINNCISNKQQSMLIMTIENGRKWLQMCICPLGVCSQTTPTIINMVKMTSLKKKPCKAIAHRFINSLSPYNYQRMIS